ncbi:MAG: DUF302 domain-containing protein [Thermodesulfobacteriota bacterium]|nr:DUF302 domain-containing protein [Thermodesulfobacteriota bacterium]
MRRMLIFVLLFVLFSVTAASAGEGLVTVKSSYKAKETADRVERLAKERGMTLFNRIDHAEGARTVGMPLRPTEVLIFGNPKGGTPLMTCEQRVGIDLPLKMLVWEDEKSSVWIGYSDPEVLKDRYDIAGCDAVIGKMKGFLGKLASDAARRDS